MLTKEQAINLVSKELGLMSPPDDVFVIVPQDTIEKPFGWVFFYNSRSFLRTGDWRCRLAGNGPVIVNRDTGQVHFHGTATSIDHIIDAYTGSMSQPRLEKL